MTWNAAVYGLERIGIASRGMGWTCDSCGMHSTYTGWKAPPHAPRGWGSAVREMGEHGLVLRHWHVCGRCIVKALEESQPLTQQEK